MNEVYRKVLLTLVQLVILFIFVTTLVQQGWITYIKTPDSPPQPCILSTKQPLTTYSGQISDQELITFTNPDTYSGPVVQGWEPGKARNITSYLRPNDATVLIEPQDPNDNFWCQHTKIIIFQHTRPGSFSNRRDNRRTWINFIQDNEIFKVFYVVGRASGENALKTEAKILEESKIYHDILQLDFIDHANNNTLKTLLTLKYILGIKWDKSYPDYVMKADDDVYINLPLLQSILFSGNFMNLVFCILRSIY